MTRVSLVTTTRMNKSIEMTRIYTPRAVEIWVTAAERMTSAHLFRVSAHTHIILTYFLTSIRLLICCLIYLVSPTLNGVNL